MATDPVITTIAGDDADAIGRYVAIRNAITPDNTDSIGNAAWEDATYPGQVFRLAATAGGDVVAVATTGRLHIYPATHPGYYIGCWVLPDWRRQGIGTALVNEAAVIAAREGKTEFRTWVSEAHAEAVSFFTGRGFVEVTRDKAVELVLVGRPIPAIEPPAGFDIVRLAAQPDLADGVWRAAVEALPSIPSDAPVIVSGRDEFVARNIDHPNQPPELFAVALDTATGEVAGYASLRLDPADPLVAFHDMTAVRPRYRGRGVATALKRATIAWAIEAGLRRLETGNDERNVPMRAVNRALGYTPLPDFLALRGPLMPGS